MRHDHPTQQDHDADHDIAAQVHVCIGPADRYGNVCASTTSISGIFSAKLAAPEGERALPVQSAGKRLEARRDRGRCRRRWDLGIQSGDSSGA